MMVADLYFIYSLFWLCVCVLGYLFLYLVKKKVYPTRSSNTHKQKRDANQIYP